MSAASLAIFPENIFSCLPATAQKCKSVNGENHFKDCRRHIHQKKLNQLLPVNTYSSTPADVIHGIMSQTCKLLRH